MTQFSRIFTKVRSSFSRMVWLYVHKRVARSAAALSFFLTLSLFPMIICLHFMLTGMSINESDIIELGGRVIPADTANAIVDYISYICANNSPLLLYFGITVLLTSSSAAFRTLMNSLEDMHGSGRFPGLRGFVFSFLLSIVFLIFIYFGIIVLITGKWFENLIAGFIALRDYAQLWTWVRFVVLFFAMYLMIYGLYALSYKPWRLRRCRTGALAVTLLLVAVSTGFSRLISLSATYSVVYGSLASMVILLMWFYICGTVVIMGGAMIREKED